MNLSQVNKITDYCYCPSVLKIIILFNFLLVYLCRCWTKLAESTILRQMITVPGASPEFELIIYIFSFFPISLIWSDTFCLCVLVHFWWNKQFAKIEKHVVSESKEPLWKFGCKLIPCPWKLLILRNRNKIEASS